jgi:hypothetical protein
VPGGTTRGHRVTNSNGTSMTVTAGNATTSTSIIGFLLW